MIGGARIRVAELYQKCENGLQDFLVVSMGNLKYPKKVERARTHAGLPIDRYFKPHQVYLKHI